MVDAPDVVTCECNNSVSPSYASHVLKFLLQVKQFFFIEIYMLKFNK